LGWESMPYHRPSWPRGTSSHPWSIVHRSRAQIGRRTQCQHGVRAASGMPPRRLGRGRR